MRVKPKYIFLDFDGVVTSQLETPGSYITHEANEYGPSPTCVVRLKRLCDETGAKVVISSNWRRFDDFGQCSFWTHAKNNRTVANPLPYFKKLMGKYVIGSLPKCRHITKSQALILWFEENNLTQDQIDYVIFDDDLAENYHLTYDYDIKHHFVLTDAMTGLTDADIIKAKKILGF